MSEYQRAIFDRLRLETPRLIFAPLQRPTSNAARLRNDPEVASTKSWSSDLDMKRWQRRLSNTRASTSVAVPHAWLIASS
jgi:hypothetical protein